MNLNWSEMKKEHKQALVLAAMWVVGGLFALYQFVLAPFFVDRGESVGELDDLRSQILKAQMAMSGEARIRSEYAEAAALFEYAGANHIVPENNPLAWVQDRLYACAGEVGVGIQSVSPVGISAPPAWEALVKEGRLYRPYTVRVVTECGYPQLVALVGALERSNPYLTIMGITIAAQDISRTRHQVTLVLEWPMWGRQPKFQMKEGGTVSDDRSGGQGVVQSARADRK